MIVTLNEYTLALLCGGVSCLTYVLLNLNDIKENKLIRKKSDEADDEHNSSPTRSNLGSRRQSQIQARFRAKRAESIKNDHVMFADEIKDDDEKFTPNIDVDDEEVEGILQNTDSRRSDVDDQHLSSDFEVPSLNTFDKSLPLDDLLIRRRSLHSSPANSRSGSRTGTSETKDDEDEESAQDVQIQSLKAEITTLRNELSQLAPQADVVQENTKLKELLQAAVAKLYPEKSLCIKNDHDEMLSDYANDL